MTFRLIFSSEIYRYVNKNILNHCFNGQFCLCKCCMIIFVYKCCQLFIHILVDKRIYKKRKKKERGFIGTLPVKSMANNFFSKSFISLNSVNRRPIKIFPSNLNKNEIKLK